MSLLLIFSLRSLCGECNLSDFNFESLPERRIGARRGEDLAVSAAVSNKREKKETKIIFGVRRGGEWRLVHLFPKNVNSS